MASWRVPGYTELRVLGSGGFGEVVAARHDATSTLVAVKYLHGELRADLLFTAMFRGEAEALAGLDDPHVVRLFEYVESGDGAAIVMELVDGVCLREIVSRHGATTPEAALAVLHGSLLGLAAAHRAGVVHRDYKPENVLVDGQGASKLTDFGIAARSGDRPLPAGTLAYAAPEQLAGAPATPAADVYAATATFYECVTGHPPFTGDDPAGLARQHQIAPVPVDEVPGPLRPIVAAGMAKDPAGRPADAAVFAARLERAAAAAYGQDWLGQGRASLGGAALLLAALWPTAGAGPAGTAVQGTAVQGTAVQGTAVQHVAVGHAPGLAPQQALHAVPTAPAQSAPPPVPAPAPAPAPAPGPAPAPATPAPPGGFPAPPVPAPPVPAPPSPLPLLRRLLSLLRQLGWVKAIVIVGAAAILVTTGTVVAVTGSRGEPPGTGPAGGSTTPARPAGPPPHLYLHTAFTYGLYAYPDFPAKIGLDNHNYITGLRWTLTGPTAARGTGTLHYDDCTPSCAAGTYHAYTVQVIATSPRRCPVAPQAGAPAVPAYVFNRVVIAAAGDQPPPSMLGPGALSPACGGGYT